MGLDFLQGMAALNVPAALSRPPSLLCLLAAGIVDKWGLVDGGASRRVPAPRFPTPAHGTWHVWALPEFGCA